MQRWGGLSLGYSLFTIVPKLGVPSQVITCALLPTARLPERLMLQLPQRQ